MPEQEKQEQPSEQVQNTSQYFWSAHLYSMVNKKTENACGVIEATTGQEAIDKLEARYYHRDRYRNFVLVALNRV